ncbi:MAG: glycoside hydrolase family 16 protein [Pseudomonadota bacterium]
MMKIGSGLALLSIALTGCATATPMPQMLSVPDGYKLVWSDEFDHDGLPDPTRWAYDTHRNADGWYNDELQYYSAERSENARVEGGHLIIEARREPTPLEAFPDTGGQDYTSTRLFTSERAAWQYGYFEIRAKLPCGRGLWPAIWTLPEGKSQWPDDGEIDIMEYVGWNPNEFHATVHTRDVNHVLGTQFGASLHSNTACGAFHTHSLLWTADDIFIAVDGEPYFHYPRGSKGYGEWPFDRAHHLILNIAIGGWGGQEGIDAAAFPARMEVDYVRVYQKADAR